MLAVFDQEILIVSDWNFVEPDGLRAVVQKMIQGKFRIILRDCNCILPTQIVTAPGAKLSRHISRGVPHSGAHQSPIADALAASIAAVVIKQRGQPQNMGILMSQNAVDAKQIHRGILTLAGKVILKLVFRDDDHVRQNRTIIGAKARVFVIIRIIGCLQSTPSKKSAPDIVGSYAFNIGFLSSPGVEDNHSVVLVEIDQIVA
ncbi:hypothetical protein DSECCO2_606530 [anaerobic digester metagenome]